ncbi:hypothetical protein BDR03DRAFT_1034581 [Suillus americanus]|nr:hypothetical protein BDR03DRAFT_1034581 [Suillus americanus]
MCLLSKLWPKLCFGCLTGRRRHRYSNTLPAPLIYLTKADGVIQAQITLYHLNWSFCDIYLYLCSMFNAENKFEQKDAAIYFNNEDLEVHLGRLEKTEVAEAICLRWYGNTDVKTVSLLDLSARHSKRLDGEYTMDAELQALVDKCKKTQAKVNSTISSQLLRDPHVWISLDMELTMYISRYASYPELMATLVSYVSHESLRQKCLNDNVIMQPWDVGDEGEGMQTLRWGEVENAVRR